MKDADRLKIEYKRGDRVEIVKGRMRGLRMTVDQSANDWITVEEIEDSQDRVFSKKMVEPA